MLHFGKAALRKVENFTKGYSNAEVLVREATANESWGPTGTQMNEIAQLTYNANDFVEIIGMLNKHLNERGRNWLQVFKSLQVVDYCLHMGSENVIIYFRDNVNVLKALTEFQFIDEEGKDQGVNIRQNAKDIVSLLDDEDCLREQRRARARFGMDRTIGGTPTLGDNTMKADVDVLPSHSQSEEDKLQYALESSDEEAPYKSSRNTSPSPDPTLRLPLPHPILPNLPPPVATDELEIAAAENETFTIPNTFWKDGKAEPVASQQQHISGAEPRSDGLNNRRSVADVLLLSGSHNSATTADLDVDAAQPQRPAKVVRRLSARIGDFFRPVGGVPTNPEDLQVDVKVGKVSMQQTGMKEEQQPYGPVGRPGRNNELRVGDNAPLSIVGNANDPTTTRDNGAAPPRKRAKIGHRLSTRVGDFFRSKEASKDLRVIRGDSNGEGDMQPKRMDNSQVDTKEQEEPSEKTAAEVATGEGTPYLSSITSQPPRGPTRLLETILSNPEHYRHLLKCSDADAEIILEFFQSLLDSSDLANDIRRQITTAMQRLAGKTKRFPSYFFIREAVSLTSEDAVKSGGFGEVYEARLNGEALCLKVLRANQAILDKLAKTFAREAILWSQLSHTSVLPFYGLYVFRSRLSFVSPWAENGSIKDLLKHQNLTGIQRVLLCLDTALGVEYLHAKDVIHGDIKSANVLVDSSGRAYLADFGLSNIDDPQILDWTSQSSVGSKGGTARWQAPELHRVESDDRTEETTIHNTEMSDVFAWGCFCYEIFTGLLPFHQLRLDTTVALQILQGETPQRPKEDDLSWLEHGLTESIWNLMEECWRPIPATRPDMLTIVSRLKLECPAVDPRPAPQWPAGSAMRFRQKSSDTQHSLETLNETLSRAAGVV